MNLKRSCDHSSSFDANGLRLEMFECTKEQTRRFHFEPDRWCCELVFITERPADKLPQASQCWVLNESTARIHVSVTSSVQEIRKDCKAFQQATSESRISTQPTPCLFLTSGASVLNCPSREHKELLQTGSTLCISDICHGSEKR
jgi:hypothetical protein